MLGCAEEDKDEEDRATELDDLVWDEDDELNKELEDDEEEGTHNCWTTSDMCCVTSMSLNTLTPLEFSYNATHGSANKAVSRLCEPSAWSCTTNTTTASVPFTTVT